jgi:hypothetical protein
VFKNKKIRTIALILILALGLLVRLYKINSPLADWHSFRQADTASVAREFIEHGYNLLKPKYHDLSSIQSGKSNPQGFRMVEFPIYNTLHGLTYQATQLLPINISFEVAGRLVSIMASLSAAYFIFLIVKQKTNWLTAWLATSFFLFLPYNIFYSRTILPGPLMVALAMGAVYFYEQDKVYAGISLSALSLLVKPYAVFLIVPYLGLRLMNNFNIKKIFSIGLQLLIISLPLIAWRLWIKQFPQGIPVNQWLLNQGNIRFKPAWWRWLFEERIGNLILGGWGLINFGLGLIAQIKKKIIWLFYFLLGGIFSYFVVFAWGNVQHDYYQIIAVPVIAIFLGQGGYFLLSPPEKINKYLSYLLLLITTVFSLAFSWYQVREYYKINHPEVVAAGKRVDQLVPQEAEIIAPYQGNTVLLYHTKRRGWPALTGEIEKIVDWGADYYVTVNYDRTTNRLKKECQVLEETDDYIIIDVTKCNNEDQEQE